MNIPFQYTTSQNGHDLLTFKTNQHLDVEVLFESGNPTNIYLNGYEFAAWEEVLYGLFVGIGDQVHSLAQIVTEAAIAYPQIIKENEQEEREYERHIRQESSVSRFVP